MKHLLDDLDRKILDELIVDARLPLSEVAKRLGVATGTIHLRFEKLCQSGVIKGSTLIIDRSKTGFPLTAYIGMNVKTGSLEKVGAALGKLPEVMEVHLPTGTYDLLVRVATRSVDNLHNFLTNLQNITGFDRSQTFVVLKTLAEKEILTISGSDDLE